MHGDRAKTQRETKRPTVRKFKCFASWCHKSYLLMTFINDPWTVFCPCMPGMLSLKGRGLQGVLVCTYLEPTVQGGL